MPLNGHNSEETKAIWLVIKLGGHKMPINFSSGFRKIRQQLFELGSRQRCGCFHMIQMVFDGHIKVHDFIREPYFEIIFIRWTCNFVFFMCSTIHDKDLNKIFKT